MVKINPGGLTFSPKFISERHATSPSDVGAVLPQSTIIVGEDNVKYYVTKPSSVGALVIRDVETQSDVVTKTVTEAIADADAAGITPPGGGVDSGGGAVRPFAIPDTPFVVLIITTATGTDSDKRVVYYKMDSAGALVVVGGYAGRTDGLDNQFTPGLYVAQGHVLSSPTTGAINKIAYKYPIGVAWHAESRMTVMVLPAINDVIANTPITQSLSDFWSLKELLPSDPPNFDANVFLLDSNAGANHHSRGFFLPVKDDGGSLLHIMFYKTDIDEHIAGSASPSSTYLTTHDSDFPNGLISLLGVKAFSNPFDFTDGPNAEFGSLRVAAHAVLKNSDGSAAFPFPDDTKNFDDTAGLAAENYYCQPTIYPLDLQNPELPWLMFFPRIYRKTGETDKFGVRVFSYDPLTNRATFLDFAKGQVYTLGTDVDSNTLPATANVYWDRDTNKLMLLIRSSPSGENNIIATEFGTFNAQIDSLDASEALKIRAWTFTFDNHDFYVLRLGELGTYAYDLATEQWCQFITDGDTTWNAEHGIMWQGLPTVADNTNPIIYQLDPDETQDEGALDITRVVTGGIALRGRNVARCNAVRLTASVGSPSAAAPTVSLRFSDDNGNTWEDAGSITLEAGNFNQELVWRALGLMRAPGRIFEFTDVGGLVRIDDADLETDQDEDDGA